MATTDDLKKFIERYMQIENELTCLKEDKKLLLTEEIYKGVLSNLKKIDLTSFINKSLNEIKIKFKIINYKSFWFEIDTFKDIQTTSKYFK